MRKKKRQRVRAKRGPMTGSTRIRAPSGHDEFRRRRSGRDRRHSLYAAGNSCWHHQDQRGQEEFSMAKFAIGEKVDNAANDRESGIVIAVFPTVEGNFRYAVDTEGYGALNFFNEEKLVLHPN